MSDEMNTNTSPNVDALIESAKKIYDALQSESNIERDHQGQYIAIDVRSKKYFIRATRDEAIQAGKAELPDAVFFVKRIGGIDTVSRNYPFRSLERSIHARLL